MNTSYWFKRRRYGYGWIPVTWQGWVILFVFILLVGLGIVVFKHTLGRYTPAFAPLFIAYTLVLLVGLLVVCIKKGPEPKWRWGKNSADNPEQDF